MKATRITRTIEINKVAAMICDIQKASVETMFFEIAGHYDNNDELKADIQEILPEGKIAVNINQNTVIEKLYAISVKDFMKYATEIEKRNKVTGNDDTEN